MFTQELLKYGWSKDRECHCSGTLEEIFKNPKFPQHNINVFPNKGKFDTWFETSRIKTGNLNELSTYIELTFK